MPAKQRSHRLVRYAVVGQGYISQSAVLPAFGHARGNSRLVALVSGDEAKRKALGRKYDVATYSYDEYDSCLKSGDVDAVYITLPNSQHRDYTVRAAKAGVHILCGRAVRLAPHAPRRQPTMRQEITKPAVRMPVMVHASPPGD